MTDKTEHSQIDFGPNVTEAQKRLMIDLREVIDNHNGKLTYAELITILGQVLGNVINNFKGNVLEAFELGITAAAGVCEARLSAAAMQRAQEQGFGVMIIDDDGDDVEVPKKESMN